jgi:ribosomal protein L14E/L6E/L27E
VGGARVRVIRRGNRPTEILVDSWPNERAPLFVTSSQRPPPVGAVGLPFRDPDQAALDRRLGNGGEASGRVLYVWEDRLFQGRALVAALMLHVERRRLQVRGIKLAQEYAERQRRASEEIVGLLLECMHEIAHSDGQENGCFDWQFPDRYRASAAKKAYEAPGVTIRVKSARGSGKGRVERAQVLLELCLSQE